jgi:TfoX/Sxy family transcriptional regulator of competence genes
MGFTELIDLGLRLPTGPETLYRPWRWFAAVTDRRVGKDRAKAVAMPLDEALATRLRVLLEGTGRLREVKMFGGLCFILNGNMLAGTSKHGLLLRVGKEQYRAALKRPGATPMEMTGRPMEGYVFVDPAPHDERVLREWIELAVAFVKTLPPKHGPSTPWRKRAR